MRRKGMIHDCPMEVCTRNLRKERQNGERMPLLILVPGSQERLTSRKGFMCARNMGVQHVGGSIQSTKGINGMRNQSPVQTRRAQRN
jgi:hypothetical protein